MKGKLLITGVAALSAFALFGCQQQAATTTTPPAPVTQTSTASLDVMPATEQTSSASLDVMPASQEGSMMENSSMESSGSQQATNGSMMEGNLGGLMKKDTSSATAIESPSSSVITKDKAMTPTGTTTTSKAAAY